MRFLKRFAHSQEDIIQPGTFMHKPSQFFLQTTKQTNVKKKKKTEACFIFYILTVPLRILQHQAINCAWLYVPQGKFMESEMFMVGVNKDGS